MHGFSDFAPNKHFRHFAYHSFLTELAPFPKYDVVDLMEWHNCYLSCLSAPQKLEDRKVALSDSLAARS
jgi:hypothetical protein